MSIPVRRATKQSQMAAQKPPPPRRSPARRVGLPHPAAQFVMPQVGGDGSCGIDFLRHRVVAAAGLGGRVPYFVAEPEQVDDDAFSGGMNSGSYFTELMSNGFTDPLGYGAGELADTLLPEEPPLPEDLGAATAKGSQGRSKNFDVQEDLLLVSAWLNVCMDAITGADQPRSTYYQRIHAYFHRYKKFESDRSQGSLMNRWLTIQHDVNVFCGCLSKIEARNQSGHSVDDKIASACAMFKADDKTHRNFA